MVSIRSALRIRESRLYKTIGEAATKNSAAKNELSKLHKKKNTIHHMITNVDIMDD